MGTYTHISFRTILQSCGVVFLVGILVCYITFQARNVIQGPAIDLTGSYESVSHTQHVTVTGTAKNIVKLTLNGREIHTNETGDFTHELVLENGYTILTLAAQDRFGRATSLTRTYVYVPLFAPKLIGYNEYRYY